MLRLRFVLVCLLVCSCVIPLRVSASPDPLLEGQPISVPLPAGRELSDDELLEVEGEIFWLTLFSLVPSLVEWEQEELSLFMRTGSMRTTESTATIGGI